MLELHKLLLKVPTLVGENRNCRQVARSVNVVWRTEDCDNIRDRLLVPRGFRFMRPQHVLEVVSSKEPLGHIRSEGVNHGDTSGGPVAVGTLGIRPKEVDDQRELHGIRLADPVRGLDLRESDLLLPLQDPRGLVRGLLHPLLPQALLGTREAGVRHEDLVLQNVGQGKVTESLAEELHELLLVLHLHLTGKAILIVRHL